MKSRFWKLFQKFVSGKWVANLRYLIDKNNLCHPGKEIDFKPSLNCNASNFVLNSLFVLTPIKILKKRLLRKFWIILFLGESASFIKRES